MDVLAYWNTRDSPRSSDALNNAPKYVVSNTLTEPLPWPNSTLLSGEFHTAVAKLKETPGKDLHIMGSGGLIATLGPLGAIDEYMLSIHRSFSEYRLGLMALGRGNRWYRETVGGGWAWFADMPPQLANSYREYWGSRNKNSADRPNTVRSNNVDSHCRGSAGARHGAYRATARDDISFLTPRQNHRGHAPADVDEDPAGIAVEHNSSGRAWAT